MATSGLKNCVWPGRPALASLGPAVTRYSTSRGAPRPREISAEVRLALNIKQ